MERLGDILGPRDRIEEIRKRLALRPSRFSVPDAGGCWCLDSEGTYHGKRWRENGEPEYDISRRILQQTVYCICETGEAMYQEALEELQDERMRFVLNRRLNSWYDAEFPARFTGQTSADGVTLESSPLAQTNPALIGRLRRTEDDPGPHSWLLWGDFGRGKTGLAIGYARQFIWPDMYGPFRNEVPISVRFTTLPDLMTELRATYNRRTEEAATEAEVLEKYRNCGLLLLDDMGAEQVKDTGWLEDRLYQIIGQRHGDDSPIVFTSNLPPEKLGQRIGERNMWRIVELCGKDRIVHVEGPNLRMPV